MARKKSNVPSAKTSKKKEATTSGTKTIKKTKVPKKEPIVIKIKTKKPVLKKPEGQLPKTTKLCDESTEIFFPKKVKKKIELLDLANEVAAAQLIKPAPAPKENVAANKKRGRPKTKKFEVENEPVPKKKKADSTLSSDPKVKVKKTSAKPKKQPVKAQNNKKSKKSCASACTKTIKSPPIFKHQNSKLASPTDFIKNQLPSTSSPKKYELFDTPGSSTTSCVTVSTKEKILTVNICPIKELPVTSRSSWKESKGDLVSDSKSSCSTDSSSDTDSSSCSNDSKSSLHLSTSSGQPEVPKEKTYLGKLDTITMLLSKIDTRIEFPFYEQYKNKRISAKFLFPEQKQLLDAVNKALEIATIDEPEDKDLEQENCDNDLEKRRPQRSSENPEDPWSYNNNFTCNEDDDDALSLYAESITGIASFQLDRSDSPKKIESKKVESVQALVPESNIATRERIHIAMDKPEELSIEDSKNIKDFSLDLQNQNIGKNNTNTSNDEFFEDEENYIDNFENNTENSKSLSNSSHEFSQYYDIAKVTENALFNGNESKNQTDINDNLVNKDKAHHTYPLPNVVIQKSIVCEKQRADSTSIKNVSYKERDVLKYTPSLALKSTNHDAIFKIPAVKKVHFQLPLSKPYKTVIFRNLCFNYLLSECTNTFCPFQHLDLRPVHVKRKLQILSNDAFVEEYLLFRKRAAFRQKYGMTFFEECQRRKLVRILVQMSIDFTNSALEGLDEDRALMRQTVESTLLYFNFADLFLCSDLLTTVVQRDYYICDHYIKIIAESQNFSQFKQVFVKLVDFIVGMNRVFRLDVAAHLLERVSVLYCDEQVCMAMIKVIENTDEEIFKNPNIVDFEKQLSRYKQIKRVFSDVKRKCLNENYDSFDKRMPLASQSDGTESSYFDFGRQHVYNSSVIDREKRYTSPDTTEIDQMATKIQRRKGPIFKRTLNMPKFNLKSNSDSVHWQPNNYKQNHSSNKIFDQFFPSREHYPARPKWHGHRQVAFGERSSLGHQNKFCNLNFDRRRASGTSNFY